MLVRRGIAAFDAGLAVNLNASGGHDGELMPARDSYGFDQAVLDVADGLMLFAKFAEDFAELGFVLKRKSRKLQVVGV